MQRPALVLIASTVLFAFASKSLAVGFALEQQSVSNLSYAFAGGSANAEDASTIFWNPAGLTRLQGRQVAVGLTALNVPAQFSDGGTTSPAGPLFPISGGDGGSPIGLNWIPSLYVATDLTPSVKAAVGINSPFGLKTKYPGDWKGRYQAIDSVVKTVNINPTLAWKVRDSFSIAGGLNFQYFDTKLSNGIDLGAACFGSPFGPAACAGAGILPQTRDGLVNVSGDSWGFGWNFGALWELKPEVRVGVAYRSSIKHDVKATAAFTTPAFPGPFAALTAGVTDTGARATIKTPDSLSVSLYNRVNPKWTVLADLTWTGWSKFNEIRIRFDNGTPDSVTPANWRNTLRFSLGIRYELDSRWTLRGGIGYENSAIPDSFRTARIPDNSHTLVGAGFNYRISSASSLDFGYLYAFIRDAGTNFAFPGSGTLVGNYKASASALAIQFNHSF